MKMHGNKLVGRKTSTVLVDQEVMPLSTRCLSWGCCPLVCEGFIIKLAQALWPNIGGMMSAHKAALAHYLQKEVRKNSTKMTLPDLLSNYFPQCSELLYSECCFVANYI